VLAPRTRPSVAGCRSFFPATHIELGHDPLLGQLQPEDGLARPKRGLERILEIDDAVDRRDSRHFRSGQTAPSPPPNPSFFRQPGFFSPGSGAAGFAALGRPLPSYSTGGPRGFPSR